MEQRFPPSDNRQSYPAHAPNVQPPMLSFRSFHERHFSISQRQAFFGAAYITPWHCQLPNWGQGQSYFPTGNDTVQSYQSYQSYQETPENEPESKGPDECDAQEPSATGDLDHGSLMPHLSKEAIEIFEFSRRFRQEKAAAAQLEQARLRKRRTKRRKLTKLGFALDEGDSGSESNASADDVAVDGATKGVKAERYESNEEGHESHESDEDDDWDDDSVAQEPPPTDVSFLNQKSRRADMTRKELYGMDSGDDRNASEIGINEMLERLVNQMYEDSLGLLPTPPVEETRRNKRQRSRGEESQFVDRRNQVVYWPGLPLRC